MGACEQEIEVMRQSLEEFRAYISSLHRKPVALLVEDDQDDLFLAARKISKFNVKLLCVKSVSEAVRELEMCRYDVAMIDLGLGRECGIDILKVSKNPEVKTLLIVLTGTNERAPLIKEALDAGAKFVIQKPLTDEHLNLIFGTL